MLRISRMADYALVVMSQMCDQDDLITLETLSEATTLPLPTLRKLMRALVQNELVESVRGVKGGYQLGRHPKQISIAEVIESVDGPIALTECVKLDGGECDISGVCELKANWNIVNRLIANTLTTVSLEAMSNTLLNVERLSRDIKRISLSDSGS